MKRYFPDCLFLPLRQAGHYRLAAVLELSQLNPEQLQILVQRVGGLLSPLMQQDQLSNLRQTGAALYAINANATLQRHSDFFWQVSKYAGDAVCGWIVSALPIATLTTHLAQANFALAPDGQRYLLRYHTEQSVRVLHARKDLPGIVEWFAPIHSWWVPSPNADEKAWHCLTGGDTPARAELGELVLDPACWEALASDPLEHRLADQLKGSLTLNGRSGLCRSVRLGRVRKYLAAAREVGFVEQQDLVTCVTYLGILGEELARDPLWQAAVNEALEQGQPLAQRLQTHISRSLR